MGDQPAGESTVDMSNVSPGEIAAPAPNSMGFQTTQEPLPNTLQEPTAALGGQPQDQPQLKLTPAAPVQKPIHARIAEGIMHALGGSDGKPGDWAKATIAGALGGLSGFTSQATHTPGKSAAEIADMVRRGPIAEQRRVQNDQKQQEIDLAKQREQREASTQQSELQLRKAEDARAQAASVRDAAAFEKHLTLMDQEIGTGNFESMKRNAEYLDGQAAKWDALTTVGAKPLEINGAKTPEFDHLGDAETFASQNPDAVINGYMSHVVRNPTTGKWAIMEIPNDGPKWRDIVDASGKRIKVLADSQAYLAMQEQVAKTKHFLNTAGKSSIELKEELEAYKEQGSVKGARKELSKVGGDYTKLSAGSKEALLRDANDRFTKAQAGLEKELQKPEELRDKDTVDALTNMRNEFAREVRSLTPHPYPGQDKNNPAGGSTLPDEQRTAITLKLKNLPPDQQLAAIQNSQQLSAPDKERFIKELGLKPAAPAAGAAPEKAAPAEEAEPEG